VPDDDASGHGVLHEDLNARYRDETDVSAWQARFERPQREVADERERIVAEIGLRPGERIADIGAGTGLYTFAFADAVGRDGRVYAVDVQTYFLTHLETRAKARELPQVQTVQASQRSVELPPGSIDVAFMCDAYHHIEHPAPYLATMREALRPGGRFVIVDYAKVDGAKPFIQEHLRASPDEFRAEIEAAGFRFVRAADFLDENFLFVFEKKSPPGVKG
jgi:predicted methyltransferase